MPRTASQWTAGALAIVAVVACGLIAVQESTSTWARLWLLVVGAAIVSLFATVLRTSTDDPPSSLTKWLLARPHHTWESRPRHRQPATRLAAYGPAVLGAALAVAAVTAGVVALLTTSAVSFDDLTPWIWLTAGGALALLALIIFSHAPQGPNWVERLAGVVGAETLMLLGLSITALGTLGLFNFGMDGVDPSALWTVIVAGGFITFLLGVGSRRPSGRRRPRDHDTAMDEDARAAATLAADHARAANRAVEVAQTDGTTDAASLDRARAASAKAAEAAQRAADASEKVTAAIDQVELHREQARDAVHAAETEVARAAEFVKQARGAIESAREADVPAAPSEADDQPNSDRSSTGGQR